jgi:hypothetical protein
MKYRQLTDPACAVTNVDMASKGKADREFGQAGRLWRAFSVTGALALGGCINLTAPTEPIVIELNINIQQEVIYRLAEDASDAIDENADIF